MPFSPESRLGDVLDSDAGRAVVLEHLPMVSELPFPVQARHATMRQLVDLIDLVRDDPAAQRDLFRELAAVPDSPPAASSPYEHDGGASATLTAPASAGRWSVYELEIHGPSDGNPYVDVELWAKFA